MKYVDLTAELITPAVASSLISAFMSAYEMAVSASDEIDFLGGDLREQIMPHLRNWAVEYEINRRALSGILPFTCNFENNSRNNHRHLELRRGDYLLTISQTHRFFDLPRDSVFRNEYCMNGQYCLEGFDESVDSSSKNIYAILTHGGGHTTPNFILCGIPAPDMRSWAQSVNLFNVAGTLEIVDSTPVTDEIQLGFRDSVKKRISNS